MPPAAFCLQTLLGQSEYGYLCYCGQTGMDPVLNLVGCHLKKEKMPLVLFCFFCFSEAVLCVTAPGIMKEREKEFQFHIQINYEASQSAAFKMYSRVFLSGGS